MMLPRSSEAFRRSGIREIMDLAAPLDGVLHLELGEPDFCTPAHIVDATQRAIASGAVKYTLSRGDVTLRELLAEKLRRRNGLAVGPDDVVVTTGGTGAVSAAMTALTGPGDGILLPEIGWPAYEMIATVIGARILRYRLPAESGFEPDLEQLEQLAPSARLLVVNSPSNPTGAVLSRPAAAALVDLARRYGLTIISDEVYEQIVFEGEHVGLGRLDEDGQVVSVHSFSKEFAMTGWRVGYLTAAPPRPRSSARRRRCGRWSRRTAAGATSPSTCAHATGSRRFGPVARSTCSCGWDRPRSTRTRSHGGCCSTSAWRSHRERRSARPGSASSGCRSPRLRR